MAPRREHAVATVFSTQVRSHDQKSIVVEAGGFTPTRWFLEHGSRPVANDDEQGPPKKRRKIERDHKEADDPSTALEHIPLAQVAIDFHFPQTAHSRGASDQRILDDVDYTDMPQLEVALVSVGDDDHGVKLRLSTPGSRQSVLILESDSIPQHTLEYLRKLAIPGYHLANAPYRTRSAEQPATITKCTLTRSSGQLYTVIRFAATLSWLDGASAFTAGAPTGTSRIYPDEDFLLEAFPDHRKAAANLDDQPWTPQDFYESVHVPPKDASVEGYRDVLDVDLYPFQKRAVSWMITREGAGESTGSPQSDFYTSVQDLNGDECFVDHLQGIVSRKLPDQDGALSGGLLAEEMGLGKTVELMALVSLHNRTSLSPNKVLDSASGTQVIQSRATLIVTPASILQQWQSELSRHAPHLNVYHYQGIPGSKKKDPTVDNLMKELATSYDVVLTTYAVLTREVHFAEDPPARNMRHAPKFKRKRSPLVQLEWWRICIDEAQMVESGVTSAARVARRLPRVHSWAVTGTPLKKDFQDLHGLLIFLRYAPLSESAKLWSHLVWKHKHLFRHVFGKVALRHTKALVREELRLPPQKRVVVTVPFSVIEQQRYTELFQEMCEEVGLSASGAPITDGWDSKHESTLSSMRSWLVRLRQTCLHPQVGGKNRKALGRGNAPLRTVAEVLDVMIEQNETTLRVKEKDVITAALKHAHIVGNNGQDDHRSEQALNIYKGAFATTQKMLEDARQQLDNAKASRAKETDGDTETEDESSDSSQALSRYRVAFREALKLHHVCTFFTATAYYQIKTNEALTLEGSDQFKRLEAKEIELYDIAKALRRNILIDISRKAEGSMQQIKDLEGQGTATKLPKIKDLVSLGGIESRKIVEKADDLFDVIRQQAKVIQNWRSKMAEYLTKPLVDEETDGVETTGDEYEDSTKQQDELYVYFDALKAMHADLNTLITGETAPLIDIEVKGLVRAAKTYLNPETPEELRPQGVHAPELVLELFGTRNKFHAQQKDVSSVQRLIQEARTVETVLDYHQTGSRAEAEHTIVKQYLTALQSISLSYRKVLLGLEKEIELFRTTQNQRVEFYRQLQELSDAVQPYKEELDEQLDQIALTLAMDYEELAVQERDRHRSRQRFLLSMKDESGSQSEPKTCIICTNTFENGVMTVCGHQYCKECITHWHKSHKSCPMCKRKISHNDMHPITLKPREARAREEVQSEASSDGSSLSSPSSQSSIYTDVDSKLLDEIKTIDLPTSYGTKVDTLGRHLQWIREHDPGAKSIVFSQYREFLDVLGTALKEFKIGYARLGRSGAAEKFRNDPSIDCLLLDAKTDSSGLTLVNATHVFICEPLIQTAVELQAISRVHRIGQTRPTTVWMYLITDTVEEAIYEMSVARRQAHVQARLQSKRSEKSRSSTPAPMQENAIDAANSEELQAAPLTKLLVPGKGGGEVVGNGDLWQCLFGKAQKATSTAAEQELGRHLRAEAAEQRHEASAA
ncbi:hypothetical protein CLAFUW4_10010 [Fulvia fulva]|uniref:Uncharacterized protein n=1 Tax=Passalora fulva TaxID=5499 RepID=A0A9Q8PIE6_PASFU|nr:uncharacterized protein CLAFUR5_12234 [Fulvia fulva]KAK4615695.1 hypothetical protein CLAFUR4_10014 [Fulvia fulva]KAK4617410.1 hypothetical protein CLAFUR0_10012 [Fulvia fulva]UJO22970.1 hypothetical protein CLAFUR5_12234 [Fulvia fulva]WPV18760.1 hypothetical protein CLAFUW4_10010 [Fulvia fulva]WPV34066.1 hypothetical protein CLAFUW7_10011 [Fulvia fulva]